MTNSLRSVMRLPLLALTVLGLLVSGCGLLTPSDHNAKDVAFVSGMIPHHAQAVVMADFALGRPAPADLVLLARQIKAAQAPEIAKMTGWLRAWGESVPTGHAADHGKSAAKGMLNAEELATLGLAQGDEFVRLFLQGMVRHHEGAVTMARVVLDQGRDEKVKELAQAVIDGQTAEIVLMKGRLAALR